MARNSVSLRPVPMIALLGRRDEPTDALEDYCRYLGEALAAEGYNLDLVRVPWLEQGWLSALNWLSRESEEWQRRWILVQYTALGWSGHGFALPFLAVLGLLRIRDVRIAVVFHDPEPYSGARLVDRARRMSQLFVMHCAYCLADKTIVTIPPRDVSWLRPTSPKATFIPVGANLPAGERPNRLARNGCEIRTIAVFGITGDGNVGNEVSDIAYVARAVADRVPHLRLVTVGRGSKEAEARFRVALQDSSVEYSPLGILSPKEVRQVLSSSDVALFVRGPISTQRGSAIASIACALPLVAYATGDLAAPLREAGVIPIVEGDREGLAQATINVLVDAKHWRELNERSQRSYKAHFAWEAVAGKFVSHLYND